MHTCSRTTTTAGRLIGNVATLLLQHRQLCRDAAACADVRVYHSFRRPGVDGYLPMHAPFVSTVEYPSLTDRRNHLSAQSSQAYR